MDGWMVLCGAVPCHGKEERVNKGTTSARFHAFHSKDLLERASERARNLHFSFLVVVVV